MSVKGLDRLRTHVPDLNTPLGVLRLLLPPIAVFLLATAFFTSGDRAWPLSLPVDEIVLGAVGFAWLSLFFRYKDDFKARFGPLAYSKAVRRFGHPAVAIIAAAVARIRYVPGPEIARDGWPIVLPLLGWALIVVGALLFSRVLQAFGLDNLTMLYVYVPEESRLVDHRIYHLLRHPAYAAAQSIAFGFALLNGNWFALAGALVFALGLWGWVRLVEEKELIERFGPAYGEYRRRVPAFWPRWRDLKRFFGFLIAGR